MNKELRKLHKWLVINRLHWATKFWVPRVVFVLSAVLGPIFCADSKNRIRFCSTGQDLFL